MSQTFEDQFSECLSDMISICHEYVNGQADTIFVYSYDSGRMISAEFFFQIGDNIVYKSRVNEYWRRGQRAVDTSSGAQRQVLEILMKDRKQIKKLCQEFKREVPLELRLAYDVKTGRFNANVSYDPLPKKTNDTLSRFLWMKEEAAKRGLSFASHEDYLLEGL